MPMKADSMCWLQRERDLTQRPTLGLIKPREILSFRMEPEENPEWSEAERLILRQSNMLREPPTHELEKIPFRFMFQYKCESDDCQSHRMMCSDWELGQLYRNVRYGNDWKSRFQNRIDEIIQCDLHFFVGTVSNHPSRWIIIGLWYPPRDQQGVLL